MIDPDEQQVIALLAEVAVVHKRSVEAGLTRIKIQSKDYEERVHHDLIQESVEITRVPFDLTIDSVPLVRREGDLTIIPVFEEVLHVEKRLVLKEEIHVRHIQTADPTEVAVTLRKDEAFIEQVNADTTTTTIKE